MLDAVLFEFAGYAICFQQFNVQPPIRSADAHSQALSPPRPNLVTLAVSAPAMTVFRFVALFSGLGSVSCLKVETNSSMKLSAVELPTCQGTMLPKVVDGDHWQCDTLSGLKGASMGT